MVDRIWAKVKSAAKGGAARAHPLSRKEAEGILQEICAMERVALPRDAFEYFVRELMRLSDPTLPTDWA